MSMWQRKRHRERPTVRESASEALWRKIGLWSIPLRLIWGAAHRTLFGFSLLISTWPGRIVGGVGAGALLLDASFGTDAVALPVSIPLIILVALVAGALGYARRMRWEQHVESIVYDAVPGHSGVQPAVVWYPPRPAKLLQLGRWLGRFEFGFRIPGKMTLKQEEEVAEHLRARLPMRRGTSLAIDWDLRAGTARAWLVEDLPELVTRPRYEVSEDPEKVPLGMGLKGVIYWILDSNFGNLLVVGTPGGGKSVILNSVLRHLLEWSEAFDCYCIDMKGGVELAHLPKFEAVKEVAEDLDTSLDLLRRILVEVKRREKMLKATGGKAKKISKLNEIRAARGEKPLKRLVLVIDELAQLTARPETGGDKVENAKKAECLAALDEIVRLGRAEGIHVVCAMQRPDAKFVGGGFRDNIQARVATGRLGRAGCEMIESDLAGELPGIPGRGLIWLGGEEQIVQYYLTEDEDLDAVFEEAEEEEVAV